MERSVEDRGRRPQVCRCGESLMASPEQPPNAPSYGDVRHRLIRGGIAVVAFA
jgi:hypothetical protein